MRGEVSPRVILGCTGNGPCICTYEQDLADDGVDHLGLPFPMGDPVPAVAPERAGAAVSVR